MALSRAKDLNLLKRTLTLPLGGEVKSQDIYKPISGIRAVPGGAALLFEWMCDNWAELEKRLPAGLGMLSSVVRMCTIGFASEEWVQKISAFFAQKSTKGFEMALEQSLDSVRTKASWVRRDTEDVKAWLKENGYLG